MKVKKLVEAKKLTEEDINPDASVKDIADDIQDKVDELTDGQLELDDKAADKIAKETKQTADEVNAGQVAIVITDEDWNDVSITNDLYEILDWAYEDALQNMNEGVKAGANVLVEGLPGGGKTSIVEAWCKSKGLTLVALNATDAKIETAINGIPLRDLQAGEDNPNALAYAYATDDSKLGKLLNERHPELKQKCVLFVDEFNRQRTEQLRRPFMSLFNEKRNADGTLDFTENLLFSVVCINPFGNDFHDKGVSELTAAESDRFLFQLRSFDSTIPAANRYYDWYRVAELLKLGIIPPNTAASSNHNGWVGPVKDLSEADINKAKRLIKACTLAKYILNNVDKSEESEIFTQREDTDSTYKEGSKRYVTSRGLFDGIYGATRADDLSNKDKFLYWVDKLSNYTQAKKNMFHDILDDYIMDVKGLYNDYNINKTPKEIEQELNTPAPSASSVKQDAKAAADELEDDDEMFTDDELASVSKGGSTDNITANEIDSIMAGW